MPSPSLSSKLIWTFFLFSIVLFNVICYLMSTGVIAYAAIFGPSTQEGDILFYVLAGVSIVVLAAQFPIAKLVAERSSNPLGKNFTALIVRCAFSEAVMIYGFVLFLLTGVIAKMWLFSGPALISLVAAYPRENTDESMMPSGTPSMPQKF